LTAEIYEVTIEKLVYGGDGLGHLPDGRAVFVPRVLPGESISIQVDDSGKRAARGEPLKIVESSGARIAPRCKHFGDCGGCHYQHIPYDKQIELKTEILRDQLRRIAGVDSPPIQASIQSPEPWHYRNHVQFQLTPSGQLGYFRADTAGANQREILAIEECHLPFPPIEELRPRLAIDREAGISRVGVRAGSDGELTVVLEAGSSQVPEVETEAGVSVAHVFAGHSVVLSGSDHLNLRALDKDFRVSAQSFFQVNTKVAELMIAHILGIAQPGMGTVIDAYAGVGLFSKFLAPRCERLIAIESLAGACDDFVFNLDEFENVELYEDTAENVLATLKVRADLLLVDPPRAGLAKTVLDSIRRLQPAILIYISCDPATLARDTKRLLAGGFATKETTLFDMFPQTYHVESVSVFTHRPGAA
jgi:23S rRNA (uracil1939-C5)-methyltransferase